MSKKGDKTEAEIVGDDKTEKTAKSFFKDERTKVVMGVFLLLVSIFFFFSFTSYFFTWKADQSKLDLGWFDFITDSTITVDNWLGKAGALLAHRFIYKWFGIASFSFILILFILGMRVLKIRLLPLRKTIKYSLISTIWTSIFLGYLFGGNGFPAGGAHGFFMALWFNALLGKAGTALLLFITLYIFLAFTSQGFVPWSKLVAAYCWKAIRNLYHKLTMPKTGNPDENLEHQVLIVPEETEVETIGKQDEDLEQGIGFKEEREEEEEKVNQIVFDGPKKEKKQAVAELGFEIITPENEDGEEIVSDLDKGEESEEGNGSQKNPVPGQKVQNKEEDDEFVEGYNVEALGEYDPTLDLSHYEFPPFDLLERYDGSQSSVTNEELVTNKNKIVETLGNYKIQITSIKATIGPTVTLYEIVPAPGIKISKIKSLEDDIALSLSALGIRIIAPIPGKGTIGIEVPNQVPEVVSMRSVITNKKFTESKFELPIVLGKTISNETFVFDLTKLPHLLVAGATGQGKSVGLNAILTSLLYKKHPSQLKFVMVDPKKVELTLYSKIEKHFLAKLPDDGDAIITDTQKVVYTLNSLCIEMEQRYDLLKKAHTRNLKEYNVKFVQRKLNPNNGHRFMPYIVVVIDEFADLIMTAGKEIELPLARLAQLARAIGIHLVIATQRPTTNIITGLIKANFPARIAFRVTSSIDSRTILDAVGANQLIGRGDMLVSTGSDMVRVQCAFVDTPEVERITDFIASQQAYPTAFYLPEFVDDNAADIASIDLDKRDSLFEEAARIIVLNQQGSTSLIQRKFSIGYNRAGRIMDQLEAAGVVGPNEGSKARQVLITDEYSLEQMFSRFN